MSSEIEIKTERIVELLLRKGLGGLLINSQHNFAWITGGSLNGIDLSRESGSASIFVRNDGKRFLLANIIEIGRMLSEEVSENDFEPVTFSWQAEKELGNSLTEMARRISPGTVASDIPLQPAIQAIDGLIASCRYQLTDEEILRYGALGSDAAKAIRNVFDVIRPGLTELEIAGRMRGELAKENIHSVVTLVAADERLEKFRHPVPTSNRWKQKVMIVTCAKRGGLIVNMSRIAFAGTVPDELAAKTEAAAYVNASLWSATAAGSTGAELYRIAAQAYEQYGYPDEIDKHHQGGATGYRTRDWVAHPKSLETVHINQAFAWNPSITGTKVEETVIVTQDGCVQCLTSSPEFPLINHTIEGREYRSSGIFKIH